MFTFIGVVLYMVHDPSRHMVLGRVLGDRASDAATFQQRRASNAYGPPGSAPLRVAHGVSALALVVIFLALHITNHLTGLAGAGTYDAVMKVFRQIYRTKMLQPLVVALFLFQIGTGLFFVWRQTGAPSDRFRTFQIASASTLPSMCWAT